MAESLVKGGGIDEWMHGCWMDDSPSRCAGDISFPRRGVVVCDEPRSASDQSKVRSSPPPKVPSPSPPLELPSPSP